MHDVLQGLHFSEYKNFELLTLRLDSASLKNNPWQDSSVRLHAVLKPRGASKDLPVVIVLSGFAGNAPVYLAPKIFESNFGQLIDEKSGQGEAPRALYVFVDGLSAWGGGQFINSKGMGNYEDMIVKELVPVIQKEWGGSRNAAQWAVIGGSSGGFGALHLATQHPVVFGIAAAVAPDSFFEMSLLPQLYEVASHLRRWSNPAQTLKALRDGDLKGKKYLHELMNAIAMGLCYSPNAKDPQTIDWPIDLETGVLKPDVWARWKKWDPLEFLPERASAVKKLKNIWLCSGKSDQYHLQYGARQLRALLEKSGAALEYSEFDGSHFDLSSQRPLILSWLQGQWRT